MNPPLELSQNVFAGHNSAIYMDNNSIFPEYRRSIHQSEVTYMTSYDIRKIGLVLKILAIGLIMIIGTLGNIIVIVTIVKDKYLHRPPFYYLINLCVADLSRAALCLPFVLASVVQNSIWTHGQTVCTLVGFANTLFVFGSITSLLSISIDRHLAVAYSEFYRRRSQGMFILGVTLLIWLVSFAISFPPVFGVGTYEFVPEESLCVIIHKEYRHNDTFGFLLVFTAVVFGTILFYIRIFFFLREHRKMRPIMRLPAQSSNWTFFGPGNGMIQLNVLNIRPFAPTQIPTISQNLSQADGTLNVRTHRNEHLTRLFFVITILYDCLWVLHTVQSFVVTFKGTDSFSVTFRSITAWLTYVQVCNCPVIFLCCCQKFRRAALPGFASFTISRTTDSVQ